MRKEPITIKDLARILNLSTSTVSRALRDVPEVAFSTKVRVKSLAAELDYQPSKIALGLLGQSIKTIGVSIPGFMIHFYASAITGIQETASEHGYNVIFCQSNEDTAIERSNIDTLVANQVDGVLASLSRQTRSFDHFHRLHKKGIPLVMFNRVTDQLAVPKVLVDDYEGAFKATRHLIESGCRRIAHIAGPKDLSLSQNRIRGYKDALKDAGLTIDPALLKYCDFTPESAASCTREFLQLEQHPDSIFVVCDTAAFGVIRFLKQSQVAIPSEISVIGFTGEPWAEYIDPGLTTIEQPSFEIGKLATLLLLDLIENRTEPTDDQTVLLRTELVIRNSTKPLHSPVSSSS